MNPYAHQLVTHGIAVIPVLTTEELKHFNKLLHRSTREFPEYKNPTSDTIFVLGGFGALGNPASFHCPLSRSLRMRIMLNAVPLFSKVDTKNRNLEQLFDRMSIRKTGTSTTAEAWHRDQTKGLKATDDVFGGWINLDLKHDQHFSCVPGTHMVKQPKDGFSVISKAESAIFKTQKKKITVPPGHWVVFYQNIAHEVVSKKMKFDSVRLFMGWRLTPSTESLFDYTSVIFKQGCPPIPSGQRPPMYANNHMSFHQNKLIQWSLDTFKPQTLVHKRRGKDGSQYMVVERYMRSLQEYGFQLYPAYKQYEIDLMKPRKSWIYPGKHGEVRLKKSSSSKSVPLIPLAVKPGPGWKPPKF